LSIIQAACFQPKPVCATGFGGGGGPGLLFLGQGQESKGLPLPALWGQSSTEIDRKRLKQQTATKESMSFEGKLTNRQASRSRWMCWQRALLCVLSLALLRPAAARGQAQDRQELLFGKPFPEMEVETLHEREITLPQALNGQVSVLTLAFEMDAQDTIDTWAHFLKKEYGMDAPLKYMEVPMISGAYWPVSGFITGGMRDGIDSTMHDNVATFFGNRTPYFEQLKMPRRNSCYVFVLDREGVIRFTAEGAITPEKKARIAEVINELLALGRDG
jgi:hypothetical protein